MRSFLQLFSVLSIIAQDDNLRLTPSFYTIYQIRVYIRMIHVNEGALNIITIHLETLFLTYVICGINVILLSIITPRYLISSISVNIEPPITTSEE